VNWEDLAFKILYERFGSNSFYAAEAAALLKRERGYKIGTTYRLLKDLADSGKLVKIGYGIYKIGGSRRERFISPSLPPNMEKARELLLEKGVEFMITGLSVLVNYMHLLPRRMIHLIYALKGAGEYVADILRDEFDILVNPTEEEVNVALSISEKDLVVVREFSNLYGGREGVASIERALVDLYFESTRHKIPFPAEEAGRIILSVLKNARIDFAKLNKSASRRGVDGEFRAIMKIAGIDVPSNMTNNIRINRYVESILSALRRGI